MPTVQLATCAVHLDQELWLKRLHTPVPLPQVLDQDRSPMLFSLVFGEGVVNDAVSIVLLRAVQGIRCALMCVLVPCCVRPASCIFRGEHARQGRDV